MLAENITNSQEFQQLTAALRRGARVVTLGGLSLNPARALVLAALQQATGRTLAIVTQTNGDAENWAGDIGFWRDALAGPDGPQGAIVVLPASENDPYVAASPHAEILEQRALALWQIARERPAVVCLTARSWAQRVARPDEMRDTGLYLQRDEDFPFDELRSKLLACGYIRQDPVTATGDFSVRGGILDIWPPGRETPVRVEFFGDTVDSLRAFDPTTQLSTGPLQALEVPPMRELAVGKEDFKLWSEMAREQWDTERFDRALRDRTVFADDGETFAGWEWLMPLLHEPHAAISAYLPDALWVVDEPAALEKYLTTLYDTLARRYAETEAADELGLPPESYYLTAEELRASLDDAQLLELRALGRAAAEVDESLAWLEAGNAGESRQQAAGSRQQAEDSQQQAAGSRQPAEDSQQKIASRQPANSDTASQPSDALLPAARRLLPANPPAARRLLPANPPATRRLLPAPLFLFPVVGRVPEVYWPAQAVRRYHNRWPDLARDLRAAQRVGETVLVLTHTHGMAERIREVLHEYEVTARMAESPAQAAQLPHGSGPVLAIGYLSGGFALGSARLRVQVEADLLDEAEAGPTFAQAKRGGATGIGRKRAAKSNAAAFLSDFRDLKPGDFVVHIDHGLGRFGGLQTLDMGGRTGEFMLLYYAEESKLFVPVERLDLVQRYASGDEDHKPALDRLGGLGWQKTKAKAKRAMRDMADELLRLYAERKLVGGYAFAGDSPWQDEFEDAFEYELTPDQATSVNDVKQDMEAPTPMDRLLCGDVGYGKTEVAMRAAFKSVMESKQVAVLTPTTVLAYQHYESFRRRFAAFPVTVELLSRLRGPKEQKEILKRLDGGSIDIIVGTHRILSKDIVFRDLGLVVVDEEQRFGVAHKERLKKLKKKVDVLTLSATPIPRTLNMSLMGMRDMSVIETPPRDRLAINTQVVQSTENVIKSAIELELGRGGQVFFIHNRVETIDSIAALVKKLVPHARVAVGHGQMNEHQLEKIMLDFVNYKYDVLVATTIIENGIDIPRANTIIINRADNYGLSQLYQLRGRVGRSNRRAYAYLLIPSEHALTPIARRRLAAIREFSDLGAGFRIAALDLELRGAGNLLGGEQSGHLNALGFDLYAQMLERTVQELRGEAIEDEPSVSINLGVNVAIPEDYISDMGQRLRVYKRISSARDDAALQRIRAELQDRYGRVTESVDNLLQYAQLRRLAEELGAVGLDRTPNGVGIKLYEKARVAPDKLLALVQARPNVTFTPNGVLRVGLSEAEKADLLPTVRSLLESIKSE